MSSLPASPRRSADAPSFPPVHVLTGRPVAWMLGRWDDAQTSASIEARRWVRHLVESRARVWTGITPGGNGGRPRLLGAPGDGAPPPLQVSISHSGSFIAVAVAETGRIGIDVETHLDAFASPALERRLCAPRELAHVRLVKGQADDGELASGALAYLRALWVVKEARVKATGAGLATDLRTLDAHDDAVRGLRAAGRATGRANRGAPYAACLTHDDDTGGWMTSHLHEDGEL